MDTLILGDCLRGRVLRGLLPLTAAERGELTRLRRENGKLKVEREISQKAATCFVTESMR